MKLVEFKTPRTLSDIRSLPFVESVHKEWDDGSEQSYWVYLDTDYKSVFSETSQIHEKTVKDVINCLKSGIYYAPNVRP